jgi:hypothetical protein
VWHLRSQQSQLLPVHYFRVIGNNSQTNPTYLYVPVCPSQVTSSCMTCEDQVCLRNKACLRDCSFACFSWSFFYVIFSFIIQSGMCCASMNELLVDKVRCRPDGFDWTAFLSSCLLRGYRQSNFGESIYFSSVRNHSSRGTSQFDCLFVLFSQNLLSYALTLAYLHWEFINYLCFPLLHDNVCMIPKLN